MKRNLIRVLLGLALAVAVMGGSVAHAVVELNMYYPVAVGGPIPKFIDDTIAEFEKANRAWGNWLPGDAADVEVLTVTPLDEGANISEVAAMADEIEEAALEAYAESQEDYRW